MKPIHARSITEFYIAPMLTTDYFFNQVVYPIEENFVNLRVASDEDEDSDWGGENEDLDKNVFDFFVNGK